jgi:hypothetical protein
LDAVTDLYVFDFSGGDEERARRAEERARERALVRARYAAHLVRSVGIDEVTADLVLGALFDHNTLDGSPCVCSCHPRLPGGELHDAGFDCSCAWDHDRRDAETGKFKAWLTEFWDGPAGQERQCAREREQAELAAWIEQHPGVTAQRTTSAAPEQWEGTVDGRSFYFRERHGEWRIELDLEPTGHFAQRLSGTGPDGQLVTEPVEITQGTVIAEGLDSALAETASEHLEFIVGTIREHITGEGCPHHGAINFCPTCGART